MTIVFAALTGLVIFLIFLKVRFQVRYYASGIDFASASVCQKIFKVLWIVALISSAFGLVQYTFVLFRGSAFAPLWIRASFVLALVGYCVTQLLYLNRVVTISKIKSVLLATVALLLLVLGVWLSLAFIQAKAYPVTEDCVMIDLPFQGSWIVFGSGATGATNHHDRIRSQKYAIDIARVGDNGKLFTGAGKTSQQSNTWGAPILSPIDGEVTLVVDSLEDDNSKKQLAGNHVTIKLRDSVYVLLAHFMKGSVLVKVGDRVKSGQPIAKAGNSGNTDFPHLHIQVQTTPGYDIKTSRTLPFRFISGEVRRFLFISNCSNFHLLSNDLVKNTKVKQSD